jgi:hypothetical protein
VRPSGSLQRPIGLPLVCFAQTSIKVNPSTIAVKFRHASENHEFQLSECPPRKGLLVTGLAAGERAALLGDIWRTSDDFIPPAL